MKDFLEIIGVVVMSMGGIGIIILGLSSWIGNIWANKFYEKERKKQEEYLKEIQSKFDIKLAELNGQLEKNNMQFEILNRERIDVIKNLYTRLVDVEDYLGMFFSGITGARKFEKPLDEYLNLSKFVSDFMDYNNHNRIFFSEEICHSLSEIDAIITILLNLYNHSLERDEEINEVTKEKAAKIVGQLIKEEIPKFRKELENEFRKIIGVIN